MSDLIAEAVAIVEDVVAGNLTGAEELLLADILAAPQASVTVRIAVKLRGFHYTFATIPAFTHTFPFPIPSVFCKAYPNPVNVDSNGIQFSIHLAAAPLAAPVPAPVAASVSPSKAVGEPIAVAAISAGPGVLTFPTAAPIDVPAKEPDAAAADDGWAEHPASGLLEAVSS